MMTLPTRDSLQPVDVIVRTKNSGPTLRECLQSATENLPVRKLIVIDNYSGDNTLEIASSFNAEIHRENTGLGFATRLGIETASSELIVFLDSDAVITDRKFLEKALMLLHDHTVGAVVGQAENHVFSYGLPLSLTVMPLRIAREIKFDDRAMGRETYFMQDYMRSRKLKVRYLSNSITHNSTHRSNRFWPEWQGAWIRNTSGLKPREVIYSMLVVFLMLSNSKSVRNFLYIPIFQAKIIRGMIHPLYWQGNLHSVSSLSGKDIAEESD